MLGYLFFFMTAFFYACFVMLTASKPPSNEYGMGYGLGVFFLIIGFAVSGLILTLIILSKSGFVWLFPRENPRPSLVLLAWLLIPVTMYFCAIFKWEWHVDMAYPSFLRWVAVTNAHGWLPLLWLAVCFLSLRTEWQPTLSPAVGKIPFWVSLTVSAVFAGGLVVGLVADSVRRYKAEVAREIKEENQRHRINLDRIAAHQPQDALIDLLSYSTRNRPEDIRKAALAKIKAHPNWEAELLRLLKNKNTYQEVYNFLDGNAVEHPGQFIAPLKQSINWLSDSIREDIEDSNNLPEWSYDMYGIDKLLRAIDEQYQEKAVDFYPNVVKLKQALYTTPPERFKGVRFNVTDEVEDWLKKHRE